MAQNEAANKTDKHSKADRRTFLRAFYGSAPEDLYLELRCIHPTTGEVRTLWSRMGSKRQLASILKQADALNDEGFGVYFAPCLRRETKGSADSATWVPALWIDIDGDEAQRQDDLERLRRYDPAPSFILSSGGGWHAYWLLETHFELQAEVDRQKIAGILRGLFSDIGGDPSYVKSVASVMRLPESVNTKPDRGGVVEVVESHPEHRYPLTAFAWLESESNNERDERIDIATVNGTGQAPLPPRTEQYLASGAPEGSRNAELFAAACQMRDAGYSQIDAERELIARYIADGSGSGRAAAREKEARATISSVYSRPAREPLAQSPRQQIDALMRRYQREDIDLERPSAAQIAEAVRACARLDPVQWAAERKRLKAICAQDLRLADLDRLYREARRDLERAAQAAAPPDTERYVELDGCMIYERQTARGSKRQIVADWTGHVLEWITRSSDDDQAEHVMRLQLNSSGKVTKLDVPSELFGDANALQRFIAQKAGGIYAVRAGMHKHLVSAILKLSGDPRQRQTYGFMGWTRIDGRWVYVSPDMSIDEKGQVTDTPEVELESRLSDYRLAAPDWQDGLAAFQTTVEVFPPEFASVLVSFALLPLFQRFFPPAAPKPALHLSGTTGSGKSEIASLMTSFYGAFTRDTPPGQWGDTVNTVEVLGFSLADALFWVDDYKQCYADERGFTRFLQSYSRGMGRRRLTREAKLRQERPCRGLLLSTDETTIEGEASVLSRMLVLEIPPWEQRDPAGEALVAAEALRHQLPAFTSRIIRWLAALANEGTLSDELARRFEQNSKGYRKKLAAKLGRQANTGRVIGNWAVLVTVYQTLARFWNEMGVEEPLKPWQDTLSDTVQRVQQERASDGFVQALNELLASGEAVLTETKEPGEPCPGVTVVGYEEGAYIYLLPEIAYREAMRIRPLKFSAAAIGSQLKEEGWLVPGGSESHLTVQIRVRGRRVRVWRLKSDLFRDTEDDINPAFEERK